MHADIAQNIKFPHDNVFNDNDFFVQWEINWT